MPTSPGRSIPNLHTHKECNGGEEEEEGRREQVAVITHYAPPQPTRLVG